MATVLYFYLPVLLSVITLSSAHTYVVKITTEQHVNVVDSRFLSFTIDPKYLFSSGQKYSSKECVCMASSLAPAYLRIAGPSTAHMSFHNTTISINDLDVDIERNNLDNTEYDGDNPKKVPLEVMATKLAVSHREWRKFVYWAKSTGFDLVFALNNDEKTASGMWDPNTALNILTVAEKAKVGDIFWELGYECSNQSIEEYLNDLETLRVIIETFPPGRTGEWKVVGGDVTRCLQADSKSDFKDYITLSDDMMDALLLNGNSSSLELERMPESDRYKLLRLLSHSTTPLWLTETNQRKYNQLERAADWLASLGYSAKNGFSIHYRELDEEEMYEPTLSFYMALLFKNLVGERVLNVEMEPDQAILFAHCTSLRHKPVPGAVTLFGVNMDDETARFSLKLSKQENGGDIMQFILGHDHSGNIVVNGRAMYYEGDIKPVVKRVRPYKTLIIHLPPKSFGFWVLANTNVEACQEVNDTRQTLIEAETVTDNFKVKRSVDDDFEDYLNVADLTYDFDDTDTVMKVNKELKSRILNINKDLNKIFKFKNIKGRYKREDEDHSFRNRKLKVYGMRPKTDTMNLNLDPKSLIDNILQRARQSVHDLKNKGVRVVKRRLGRNKDYKRYSRNSKAKTGRASIKNVNTRKFQNIPRKRTDMTKMTRNKIDVYKKNNRKRLKNDTVENIVETRKTVNVNEIPKKSADIEENLNTRQSIENEISIENHHVLYPKKTRRRRHAVQDTEELSQNDIELDDENKAKFWQYLKKIHKNLRDFSDEADGKDDENESHEGIILKTELSDDTATIKVKDSGSGLIKSTMKNMVTVLEDLNNNLNRFWDALSLLE